jgi:restriction system protein
MSQVHFGEVQEHYNVAGTRVLKYTLEMSHNGLNEHKLISAPDPYMLKNKAREQGKDSGR